MAIIAEDVDQQELRQDQIKNWWCRTSSCSARLGSYRQAKTLYMARPMTQAEIIDHLATKSNITKKAATQILADLAALACREAKNTFRIPGLGKLVLASKKARIGRNPRTGEAIKIPAKRVVKFRLAKAARGAILGEKTAPRPVEVDPRRTPG